MAETTASMSYERCRCLFSKGLFMAADRDSSVPESEPQADSGPFWCAHTQTCLGPDGRIADDRECRPGRACYEGM